MAHLTEPNEIRRGRAPTLCVVRKRGRRRRLLRVIHQQH